MREQTIVHGVPPPIAHFLGEAAIEFELDDFVGQRFLEGRE